jgi:gluconolactonase
MDAAGNVSVACLLNGGIATFSPEGEMVRHLPLEDRFTTNICFGGKDLRTAFITLSSSGYLVSMDWPEAGLPLNFLNK